MIYKFLMGYQVLQSVICKYNYPPHKNSGLKLNKYSIFQNTMSTTLPHIYEHVYHKVTNPVLRYVSYIIFHRMTSQMKNSQLYLMVWTFIFAKIITLTQSQHNLSFFPKRIRRYFKYSQK